MWLIKPYLPIVKLLFGGGGRGGRGKGTQIQTILSPEVFDTLVHGFEGIVDIVCQQLRVNIDQ